MFSISKYMDELIDKELVARDNKIGELRREIQGLTDELSSATATISTLEDETRKAKLQAEKHSLENKRWKPERVDLNVRIGELEYELRTIHDKFQVLSEEHEGTLGLLTRSEQRSKDQENELAVLSKQVENYYRDKEILESKLAKLESLEEMIRGYGA